jgi:sec-independent protein translocase protein TatA
MGSFSLMHWGIVLVVVLLLFGKRRLSGLMGEMGSAIGTFKKTMAEEEEPKSEQSGASGTPPSILV